VGSAIRRHFRFGCGVLIAATILIQCRCFAAAPPSASKPVCGVYTSISEFDSLAARQGAIAAQPSFLSDRHKHVLMNDPSAANIALVKRCGFNTLFMTLYPLSGDEWWNQPAARNLVKDALIQTRGLAQVHLGLSLFNEETCGNPARFPGASRTIQCDGTRPSWICFNDDRLWDFYIRNTVEMAKLGQEVPGTLDGIFIDPESYGPECYLCFCDNCVDKFNAWAHTDMPHGLVKPDAWLHEHQLWEKYTVDWHNQEVRRHAMQMRDAIHAVNPKLQLSSLLWEYPVAVGQKDARAAYFKNLAIGLGSKEQPSWTMPEHTYYSDAADLDRIIGDMTHELAACGFADQVRILPGIRLLRRPAASLANRGETIAKDGLPGYWLYELADLGSKKPIDFEGTLVDPPDKYIDALHEMNAKLEKSPQIKYR
jgi:hypothetical protein